MSTHNICFYGELTKIMLQLSSNTLFICSSAVVGIWMKGSGCKCLVSLLGCEIYVGRDTATKAYTVVQNRISRSSSLRSSSVRHPVILQLSYTGVWSVIVADPVYSPSLDHFRFIYIHRRGIFYLCADQCWECCCVNACMLGFDVPF